MFADIASGNVDGADVCFLIAVIVAGIGAVAAVARPPSYTHYALALALVAIGLLALGLLLL